MRAWSHRVPLKDPSFLRYFSLPLFLVHSRRPIFCQGDIHAIVLFEHRQRGTYEDFVKRGRSDIYIHSRYLLYSLTLTPIQSSFVRTSCTESQKVPRVVAYLLRTFRCRCARGRTTPFSTSWRESTTNAYPLNTFFFLFSRNLSRISRTGLD